MKKLMLLSLLIIFSMGLVLSANTITLISPANGAIIQGTPNLNATLDTNTDNVTSVNFYYRNNSYSGAWTLIGSIANTSAQQLMFNLTSWSTTVLFNDRNVEFNVTGENFTGGIITSDTSVNVSIDNGKPTASYSSSSAQQYSSHQSGNGFLLEISPDTTIGVANCTIYMNSNTLSIEGASGVCSRTLFASNFSITSTGEYTYVMQVWDDNSNHTNTTQRQVTFYFNEGTGTISRGGGGGGPAKSSVDLIPKSPSTTVGTEQSFTGEPTESGDNFIVRFFRGIKNFFKKLFRR